MKTTIYAFLKYFEQKSFARAFVEGRLYLNPLSYFQNIEGAEGDGRADRYEALVGWHQPVSLGSIEFAGIRIDPSDLAGPLVIQDDGAGCLNVLCMYAIATGPFDKISADNLGALCAHLRIPERCRDMGDFVVLVRQPRRFIERVVEAATREGFGVECGLVDYFDPGVFSGAVHRPAFMKRREFAWQREYRFALDRRANDAKPHILDAGPMSDLCTVLDAPLLGDPVVRLPEHG